MKTKMRNLLTVLCSIFIMQSSFAVCTFTITTTATLTAGYTKHPYSEQIRTANGFGKVTFSLASGALPNGIQMQTNGSIGGNFSLNGAAVTTFDVIATDEHQCVSYKVFSITNTDYIFPTDSVQFLQRLAQIWTRSNQSPPPYYDVWDTWNNITRIPIIIAGTGIAVTHNSIEGRAGKTFTVTNTGITSQATLTAGSNITINTGVNSYTISSTDNYDFATGLTTTYTTSSTSSSNLMPTLIPVMGLGNTGTFIFEAHLSIATTYSVGVNVGITNTSSDMVYSGSYFTTVIDTVAKTIFATRNTTLQNSAIDGTTTKFVNVTKAETTVFDIIINGSYTITAAPTTNSLCFLIYKGANNAGTISVLKGSTFKVIKVL